MKPRWISVISVIYLFFYVSRKVLKICLYVILFNLFNNIDAARVKNVCATFRAFCEAKNLEG